MIAAGRERVWLQRHFIHLFEAGLLANVFGLRLCVSLLHHLRLHVHYLPVLREKLTDGGGLCKILLDNALLVLSVVIYSRRKAGRLHVKVVSDIRE